MTARRRLPTLLALLLLLLASAIPVLGQADPTPMPPDIVPPRWRTEGLKIDYQYVDVTIEDQVATTRIDQLFVNDNDWMLEGTYLFPLPPGAAVSQLTMWVDGKAIEAKILKKDEAREIYDTIVRELRDPALLEYVGREAVQANVFPIPPHQERRIEITYSQVLPLENGLVHYLYPQSSDLYVNAPLENQRIRVELASNEPIQAVYSPSHPVEIIREGDFRATVGFEDENVTAEDDFELYYSVSADEIDLNLLSYREEGQDGFFLLLVAPPVETEEVVAKDVIIVLDTSGSMEGEKLEQAQEAAAYIVSHLNDYDRFNLISFGTGVRLYATDLLAAGEAGDYEAYLNSLEAVGGTNISTALLEAAGQADAERPTTVIFVTDGLATEGITDTPQLLDAVAGAMPDNARIFAFGVGDDVDPDLLDNLAQNHRGTTTYVREGQAVDEAVSGFYAKVSSPILSNITFDFGDMIVEQTYPQVLPDLFAGTQLVLTGRYRNGGSSTITLSGDVGRERKETIYRGQNFEVRGGEAFIPRLWATRAIGHLLREMRLHGENDELMQSVVNLSIRYGIITPYTSYLIEEDDIFSRAGRDDIAAAEIGSAQGEEGGRIVTEVQEAVVEAEMAEAEAPVFTPAPGMALDAESGEVVKDLVEFVGSKTFVWREGVWVDTTYAEDQVPLETISFAGEDYFDLLAEAPELGQYFALGEQVVVVYDGTAYQVGATAEELPLARPAEQKGDSPAEAQEAAPTPAVIGSEGPQPAITSATPEEPAPRPGICNALLVFPGLLLLTGLVTWYGAVRKREH